MDGAVAVLVGDGDAIGEEFVEAAVVFDQVLALAADDLAQGFVDGIGGDVGVDAGEGGAEALGEDDVVVGVAFGGGFAGSDGGAVEGGVAYLLKVVEGSFFNLGFSHTVVTHGLGSLSLLEQGADAPGLVCPLCVRESRTTRVTGCKFIDS